MTEMINHSFLEGFQIYQQNDGNDYLAILNNFKAGKIPYQRLNNGNAQRDVFLIKVAHRYYVLKWDREQDPRLEKRIWQFISGPYYSALFRRVVAARSAGCDIIGNIYLVAERVRWRQNIETYLISDYIDGDPLSTLTADQISKYKPDIASVVQTLHRYQLASNDLHEGNFIVTASGLKVIDLSDRGALAICQANDLLTLDRIYQIKLTPRNWVYYLIACKEWLKQLSRKLRGKI